MSLGAEFQHFDASPFPTGVVESFYAHVAAPFWSDVDTRLDGSIWYEVHDSVEGTPESSTLEVLSRVSTFIRTEEGVDFDGNLMIVATWDHVHPWPHGDSAGQDLVDPYLQSVSELYWVVAVAQRCVTIGTIP